MLKKDFLVKLRKDAKLTREAMEKLTGIPSRSIGAYERGELQIYHFTEYAKVLSSISGLSPKIFNMNEIAENDIQHFKLTKFSQCFRQYLIWSGIDPKHLNAQFTQNNEILNFLLDVRDTQVNAVFSIESIDDLNDYIAEKGVNFVQEYTITEDGETREMQEDVITISNLDFKKVFLFEAGKIIIKIGNFKPSTMGINPSDIADSFFGETPKATTIIYNHEEGDIYYKLVELEKNGLEFNYENVKRSISEGVLLNNEEKELIELWKWAGETLKEGIMQALRDNKERDLKVTQEIMKLSGLSQKD